MDWESPYLLLLAIPALLALMWIEQRSSHPMSSARKRMLLVNKCAKELRLLLTILSDDRRDNASFSVQDDLSSEALHKYHCDLFRLDIPKLNTLRKADA